MSSERLSRPVRTHTGNLSAPVGDEADSYVRGTFPAVDAIQPNPSGGFPTADDIANQRCWTDPIDNEERPVGWKDNNPKDAFGTLKVSITSFLYMPVLAEMAIGMAAGGFKYGSHNYLVVAPRASVYTDAAIRHISKWTCGEELDPETPEGVAVHHITAAINSLHVLRAAMINGSYVDDRPPPPPVGWLEKMNASMVALAKAFPNPVARYYANGKRGPGRIL